MDLTNKKQIKKWVIKIEKETNKKVHIFISNAAVYKRSLNALDNSSSIFKTIETNLISPILLTNLLSKSMIQNKFKTDNFSSIEKIYNQINRIYKVKKKIIENIIFDKHND